MYIPLPSRAFRAMFVYICIKLSVTVDFLMLKSLKFNCLMLFKKNLVLSRYPPSRPCVISSVYWPRSFLRVYGPRLRLGP